jgi:hypothetical protein
MKRPNFLEELHSYCTALEKQNATLVQQNKELLARLQFLEEQFRLAEDVKLCETPASYI